MCNFDDGVTYSAIIVMNIAIAVMISHTTGVISSSLLWYKIRQVSADAVSMHIEISSMFSLVIILFFFYFYQPMPIALKTLTANMIPNMADITINAP